MTRKDYQLIADALKQCKPRDDGSIIAPHKIEQWSFVVMCIADKLASTNPLYDRGKFILACNGLK